MAKYLCIATLIFMLSACGSSTGGVVLEDIVGIWDVSAGNHEFIYEVRNTGEVIYYNFESEMVATNGDTGCYYYSNNEIEEIGNSEFILQTYYDSRIKFTKTEDGYEARAEPISDDDTNPFGGESVQQWTPSSKTVSDISPLCINNN